MSDRTHPDSGPVTPGEAGFTAADMATAAAQGFRDGVASLSLPAAGQEPVAWMWQHDETGRTGFVDCWQVENGWQEANPRLKLVRQLYAAPQPAVAAGWVPIETAPVAGLILLVVEDSAGERRVFPAEASHENGVLAWQVTLGWLGWTRLHSGWTPILWRRIPTPPTTSAGSGKGE